MDEDFILEVLKDDGQSRALLEVHPDIPGQRALMTTLVPDPRPRKCKNPELIIVADQSASMRGTSTKTLVSTLCILLKSIPVGVSFNLCEHGSDYDFLWDQSQICNQTSLNKAFGFLETFHAHLGGTETEIAIQVAIDSHNTSRNLSLIVANDGDIWRQEDLFSSVTDCVAKARPSSVFSPSA